jgi:hypothetical protein
MFSPDLTKTMKRFSLDLFATFLGLLMALGLEQWREGRRDQRIAQEFLSRVQVEIQQNRKEAAGKLDNFQKSLENDERLVKDLEVLLDARDHHRPEPVVVIPGELRGDYFFQTAAWEAAKASGMLRYLGADRIHDISGAYTDFQVLMAFQGQAFGTQELSVLLTYGSDDPARLETATLRRLLESARYLRGVNRNMIQLGKQILPELDRLAGR